MKKDLRAVLSALGTAAKTLDPGKVCAALEVLKNDGFRIDWEPGDEEWARAIDDRGNVAAFICARIPLGIAIDSLSKSMLSDCLTWVYVPSMDARVLMVEKVLLERIFERPLSGNIDYANMSANDLWWATVA
ncbi:MAG: hypothetical protein SFX73_20820 [Kofleriaceae bacterium]|nr:hypothetical protein [Kofleriaceae bacterium]